MSQHMIRHIGTFRRHDIRRIADDNVHGGEYVPTIIGRKNIALEEKYPVVFSDIGTSRS